MKVLLKWTKAMSSAWQMKSALPDSVASSLQETMFTMHMCCMRTILSTAVLSWLQSEGGCLRHPAEGASTGSESNPGGQRQGLRGCV